MDTERLEGLPGPVRRVIGSALRRPLCAPVSPQADSLLGGPPCL